MTPTANLADDAPVSQGTTLFSLIESNVEDGSANNPP
jgi:hypothetical protein